MADNNDITPVSGELLPATSKLSEITKDLMVANTSFEKSVTRVEKNLTPELTVELDDPIFRSMEMSLNQIQDGIRALVDGLLSSFFTINQNHIQSIAIQREMVDVADDQLDLDQEKFTYQKDQDETKSQKEETTEGDKAEAAREKSKSFRANFTKDLADANKELEEKGFATYVSDLMGFGGTIRGIGETVAKIAPILVMIKTQLLTGLTSLYTNLLKFSITQKIVKAIQKVKAAYLALQAKVLTGLSRIGAALMSFVTNPIGAIVKAVQFLSYAMTVLTATTLSTLGAIGTAIMSFVTGVLVPGLVAIGTALAPILLPAAAIIAVALYVYKWIEGFIAGFKDSAPDDGLLTKIFNGLIGATKEIFKLTLGWPLELIKRLVAWIAGALGFTEFEKMLDSFSFLEFFDTIFDKLKGVVNIVTRAIEDFFGGIGEKIGSVFSLGFDLFEKIGDFLLAPFNWLIEKLQEFDFKSLLDFGKIKMMFFNMFAEIGVPRIEFDVPVIGKVGFGPFYPFRPGEDEAVVNSKTELTTKSTESSDGSMQYEKTLKDSGSMIKDDTVFSMAKEKVNRQSVNDLGQTVDTELYTTAKASFDDETGKGSVTFVTQGASDNLATGELKELQTTLEEFEGLGPLTMGRVRRMIDAGATPSDIKTFLENEKESGSIFDKIASIFSAPAVATDVAPAEAKRIEIAQELGTQTAAREDARADQQSQQSMNVVDASTSNVSNINQSSVIMDTPSAVDGLSLSY